MLFFLLKMHSLQFMSRAFLFTGLLALVSAAAVEENNKFCIHTEPMLLADIEKHVNPTAADPNCEVLATTLTVKEKESFLNTMCKDMTTGTPQNYEFFKLRNGELEGRRSYHSICEGHSNPLLAWVPYETMRRNFAQELNPKERMNYIAKATDVEREKTELCHFRHSDMVTNIDSNLFTCIVMIFEDNFYGLESNINVLVEILPIMYEIRNVTYAPWSNVTQSYKTMLGKSSLKNPSRDVKQIYGSIDYAYVEKIKLNTSSVYSSGEDKDAMSKLPLLLEHKEAVLEVDENGIGGVTVKEKAYFGRAMDPKSTVKLDVIGQWAEHRKQFSADIYEYFGYNIKRFRHEMHHGIATFILIESTEPVYESPESSHLTDATLHRPATKKVGATSQETAFERITADSAAVKGDTGTGEFDDLPRGGQVYPEFYPWFVASALIVGAALLLAIFYVVRSCSKGEPKNKYKFSGI